MGRNTVIDGTEIESYQEYSVGDIAEHWDGHQLSKHQGKIDYIVIGRTSGRVYFGIGIYGNISYDLLIQKIQ